MEMLFILYDLPLRILFNVTINSNEGVHGVQMWSKYLGHKSN